MSLGGNRKLIMATILIVCGISGYTATVITAKLHKKQDLIASKRDPELERRLYEQSNNDMRAYIKDEETNAIYDLYQQKSYDSVIAKATTHCPTLKDNLQLVCYGLYVQALEQENKLPEIINLANEVLKSEAIAKDESIKNIWLFIQENATKGINPKDVKRVSSDPESKS